MAARGGLFITFDYTRGKEKTVLLVGKRLGSDVQTINFIEGEEAFELIKKLTGKKNL